MLINDFKRHKSIHLVILFFIMLSALLMSNGVNLIIELSNALDAFFEKAETPHFVQMHSGELDQDQIDLWSKANSLVQKQQTAEMLSIQADNLFWGKSRQVLQNNVMDISFVTQNQQFDFLLNLKNQPIDIEPGKIAVPLYFKNKFAVELGDPLFLQKDNFSKEFVVGSFVRDSQMNPAIIHSKRFLIHQADYQLLANYFSDREYLIEFRLNSPDSLAAFQQQYQNSGLPQTGPAVDINLFKILNSISDGVVAGIIIIVSLLIMLIAILCLRFVILSSLEEDYREIGVMKAIGIPLKQIKKIYLYKYLYITYLAIIIGFIISIFSGKILSSNILVNVGASPKTTADWLIAFLAANLIVPIIYLSLRLILGKFRQITAVEALSSAQRGNSLRIIKSLSLRRNKVWNLNIFLGLRDIFQQFKLYWILLIIFIFSTFIILVPITFHTTLASQDFITYLGIGKSDIRLDLRQAAEAKTRFGELKEIIQHDAEIKDFAYFVTSQYSMIMQDGTQENITIETGDFSKFPLNYLSGAAPDKKNEIALSYTNATELDKKIGDNLKIIIASQEKVLTICGIYQDITNGGKTAKALLDYDLDNSLWYTIMLKLRQPHNIEKKIAEYSSRFEAVRVTDIENYLQETLGNTIRDISKAAFVAFFAGLFIAFCITLLFLKMIISKEINSIALQISLGFDLKSISRQYLAKTLGLLGFGIFLGAVLSNTLGEKLVSFFSAFIGAPQISFIQNPLLSYLAVPLVLIITIYLATKLCLRSLDNHDLIQKLSQ
jgi:putative ABC transport system permease protein